MSTSCMSDMCCYVTSTQKSQCGCDGFSWKFARAILPWYSMDYVLHISVCCTATYMCICILTLPIIYCLPVMTTVFSQWPRHFSLMSPEDSYRQWHFMQTTSPVGCPLLHTASLRCSIIPVTITVPFVLTSGVIFEVKLNELSATLSFYTWTVALISWMVVEYSCNIDHNKPKLRQNYVTLALLGEIEWFIVLLGTQHQPPKWIEQGLYSPA